MAKKETTKPKTLFQKMREKHRAYCNKPTERNKALAEKAEARYKKDATDPNRKGKVKTAKEANDIISNSRACKRK